MRRREETEQGVGRGAGGRREPGAIDHTAGSFLVESLGTGRLLPWAGCAHAAPGARGSPGRWDPELGATSEKIF